MTPSVKMFCRSYTRHPGTSRLSSFGSWWYVGKNQRSLKEVSRKEERKKIASFPPHRKAHPSPALQHRISVRQGHRFQEREKEHPLLFVRPEMIRLWFETDGCRWFVHSYKYAWCPDASTFFNILREGQTTPMVSRTRRKTSLFR